jgi:Protein of unknown function (DUF2934)
LGFPGYPSLDNFAVCGDFEYWRKYPNREEAMARDREAQIRARAHEIWEKEGQPVGEERRHWDQATLEIDTNEVKKGAAKAAASESGSAEKPPKAAAKRSGKAVGTSGAAKSAAKSAATGAAKGARGKKSS